MTNTVFFPGLGLEFELNRVAFTVFGHNIYWYGVIIAAGFLLAVVYGLHIAPRFGMDPDKITDAIFVVVPMAIIGARLYYVIFNPAVCFNADGSFSLLKMIAFWDGGLAIYGGVIATVVSALIFCKVRKVDFWSGMDITAYGLLIGQLIGRWGNFVNVEAYGDVTGLPWRMCSESIANELWSKGLLDSQEAYQSILSGTLGVHPTFLYESLWNLLGLVLLLLMMMKGRKFNGQMFLSYVIWYGLGRAAIEGLRTDSLYFFGTPIRSSQMLGIVSALAGIALFVVRLKTAGPPSQPWVKPAAEGAGPVPVPAESAPEVVKPVNGDSALPDPIATQSAPEAAESTPGQPEAPSAQGEETSKEDIDDGGDDH